MKTAVHITHEAVQKIGGIGSVIAGLLTSDSYRHFFDRSILYGPLFNTDGPASSRLGKDGIVLYSGIDNYDTEKYAYIFSPIEKKYNISIVYGKRMIVNESNPGLYTNTETILVHINNIRPEAVDKFKFTLWENFGIQSDRYDDWDYEQYVRIAVPYTEILGSIISKDEPVYHFSHEYMGMASVLKVMADRIKTGRKICRTIFYAHEVSTARSVAENLPGKDISFYGIMKHKDLGGRALEEIFGDRSGYYRNELVKRAEHLDHIFAVSEVTAREIKFLNPSIDEKKIHVVYNGIFLKKITFETKLAARETLRKYCKTLLNYTPDLIFTHVTRLVSSKGLWRDIMLLEELDELMAEKSQTGFYILLSTLIGNGRPSQDVSRMEREYGWPVLHKEGWPDLVGMESGIYADIARFNAKSKAIKAVFINQFGFSRHSCGNRVPENAQWIDLRIGSDAEFGMSVYEPFGIAQIENIQFGGVAVLSDACGCSDLIRSRFASDPDCFHIIDFTGGNDSDSIQELLDLNDGQRSEKEREIIKRETPAVLGKLEEILNKNKLDDRLKRSRRNSFEIDWDHIVSKNILRLLNKS